MTAIVTAINHATREVTLKKDDGTEVTFVASEDVKNLPQVKVGDVLHVVYAEALAYEVRKGGTTAAPATAIAGGAAELGQRPKRSPSRSSKRPPNRPVTPACSPLGAQRIERVRVVQAGRQRNVYTHEAAIRSTFVSPVVLESPSPSKCW